MSFFMLIFVLFIISILGKIYHQSIIMYFSLYLKLNSISSINQIFCISSFNTFFQIIS